MADAAQSATDVLKQIKDTPLWVLGGVAAGASLFLIIIHQIEDMKPFLNGYGGWFLSIAIIFGTLALARLVHILCLHNKSLEIACDESQSRYSLAKQSDGKIFTQFTIKLRVTNLTNEHMELKEAQLLILGVSKEDIFDCMLWVKQHQGNQVDRHYKIAARQATDVTINAHSKRAIASSKKFLSLKIKITDQFGNKNFVQLRLKKS